MRRSLVVAGAIVLALGLVAVGLALSESTTHVSIPEFPTVLSVSVNTIGAATLLVDWSGAPSSTEVALFDCSPSGCGLPGPTVANATGAAGRLHASLASGRTYLLTENGTNGSLGATLQVQGMTLRLALGIAVAAAGVILIAWAFWGPRRERPRRAARSTATALQSGEKPDTSTAPSASDEPPTSST